MLSTGAVSAFPEPGGATPVVRGSDDSASAATAAAVVDAPDTTGPTGSVGGLRSPVRDSLTLTLDASDDGSGLGEALAYLDGIRVAGRPLGDCTLGCPRSVSNAALPLSLTGVPVGIHGLRVAVVDAAGNSSDLYVGDLTIAGPDPVFASTVSLTVGDPTRAAQAPSGTPLTTTTAPPTTNAVVCPSPRLSMWLADRPLRTTHGRAVLRAGGRYRFRGRLTCLIGGVRRGAPRGTPVDILFRLSRGGNHAVTGATTIARGQLNVILSCRSSRTLIFRHRSGAATSTVRIPVTVVRTRSR